METLMDVNVREQKVPGVAWLYQLSLPTGWSVSVLVEARSGRRQIHVVRPGLDSADATVHMSEAEAVTLGALLSGVRMTFDQEPVHPLPAHGVHVETVLIGAGSPAAHRRIEELEVPNAREARVLAVIRDDTLDLIEDDAGRACQPGDRLVLAGRPGSLEELRRFLAG